jgi:BMFP domain-containing protein YqiC
MTTIVDVSQDAGDSRRVIADMEAEAAELASKPAKQEATVSSAVKTEDRTDPRFKGKSTEEVIEMYRNLESHQGRLANELGQQRRTLDELLLAKRASDLQTNGAEPSQALTAADLLERPTEAVAKVVDDRTRSTLQPFEQRLMGIEARLAASAVANKHGANWEDTVKSAAFQTWAAKTPMRMNLVAAARSGNWDAADALLVEFKDMHGSTSAAATAEQAAQEAARKATLEGTQAGSDGGTAVTGKKYRQQDLWALRVNNPDEYEKPEVQAAIMRAYREGRVIRN